MTQMPHPSDPRTPEYRSPVRTVKRIHVRLRDAGADPDLSPFYVLAIVSGALTGYLATLLV